MNRQIEEFIVGEPHIDVVVDQLQQGKAMKTVSVAISTVGTTTWRYNGIVAVPVDATNEEINRVAHELSETLDGEEDSDGYYPEVDSFDCFDEDGLPDVVLIRNAEGVLQLAKPVAAGGAA